MRRGAITDGVPWTGHPSVGVVRGNGHFCTATLVGLETVLTAAHCVTADSGYAFETEGASYEVDRVTRHPDFIVDPQTISDHDIALLSLATSPAVEPSQVNTTPVTVGLELTLVGYGKTGTNAGFLGDKHMARNLIDQVAPIRFRFSGSDADSGVGGTCLGDSGGPAFAAPDGHEVVVGVVSSSSAECGVFTWDTRVDAYLSWLVGTSGGDLHGVATPVADAGNTSLDQGVPAVDSAVVSADTGVARHDAGASTDLPAQADASVAGDGSGSELSGGGCAFSRSRGSGLLGVLFWFFLLFAMHRPRLRSS